jgi:hypothetical protein
VLLHLRARPDSTERARGVWSGVVLWVTWSPRAGARARAGELRSQLRTKICQGGVRRGIGLQCPLGSQFGQGNERETDTHATQVLCMAWPTLSPNTSIQSGIVADAWLSKDRERCAGKTKWW